MKLIRKWIAALCITGLILWPQQAFASVSLFPALLRDPLLTLVNKDHPLSENWVMELTEIEEGYQVDRADGRGFKCYVFGHACRGTAADDLLRLSEL